MLSPEAEIKKLRKSLTKDPIGTTTPKRYKISYEKAKDLYSRLMNKNAEDLSAGLSDFVGAIDPRGIDPAIAGIRAQKAGISEKEHKRKRLLARLGGTLGGAVLVPGVTAGGIGALQGAFTSQGGVKNRLIGAGSGAVSSIRDLGSRAALPSAIAGGYLGSVTSKNQYNTGRNLASLKEASAQFMKHLFGENPND